MFRKAVIRMHGQEAGILERNDVRITFKYHKGYAFAPISLSIPVRDELYIWSALPPALVALAPEGWLQKNIAMQEKINESDQFEMLCRYGSDLIGAIEIEGID